MNEAAIHPDVERILFTEGEIASRVEELGGQIAGDYADAFERGEDLVMVGLLRGAAIFMADLSRAAKVPVQMDYMCVSSYGSGTKSSGMVNIQKDLSDDIEGKHVIIVEDVIDSGLTLNSVRENLESRGPLSVEIAALVRKDVEGQAEVDCKYQGFTCPDEFIVGYGLDYAERYRNLPYIGILKPEVYE